LYGVSTKEVLEIIALTQILPIGRKEMLVATIEEVMGITIFATNIANICKKGASYNSKISAGEQQHQHRYS
jgi:hypothetical protein